ncbi:hypothetical protein CCP3SC1AL1_2320003 [Gammaproteobacteria bacterium]
MMAEIGSSNVILVRNQYYREPYAVKVAHTDLIESFMGRPMIRLNQILPEKIAVTSQHFPRA